MFDLREMFFKIWYGRWIIISTIIVFIALAILAISQFEPTFRSSTTVMFGIQHANIGPQVLTTPEFDSDTLENEIQVLTSANLINRVVKDLNLNKDPEFNPAAAAQEPSLAEQLGLTMPESVKTFLTEYGVLPPPAPPLSPAEIERQGYMAAAQTVLDNLSLAPVTGSQVISISFSSYSPQIAANVVSAIANQYIVDQLQAKLDTTRSAAQWMSDRVAELRDKVQASEEAVETVKAELSVASGQSLEITQQQLADLNKLLSEARNRTAEVQSRYDGLNDAMKAGRDLSADSDLIRQYRETESDLLSKRDVLSPRNPARARFDAQIADLHKRMDEEAVRIRSTVEVELESARAQERNLEESVHALEAKVMLQSREEIHLNQLQREADANRLIYENMLTRMNETAAQDSLQSADVRILSPAVVPVEPESGPKIILLALAVTFGGLVGIGVIFLLDQFDNTFRIPSQVEDATGETVLGTVPILGSRIRRRDVIRSVLEKPSSSLAEGIRNLRTSILLSNVDNPPKVVMFTSSVPDEGKSTTALLTAITSRQMGKSAILVDCDLRLPSVAKLMKSEPDKPGLLSVLEGTASLQDALYQDPESGLHLLMSQPGERKVQINAADILSSQRFRDLLRVLSEQYDLVVLDAPPALIVTDARVMSSLVDSVVYLVRWNSTSRSAVLEGLKELRSVRAPIAGVVLTLVNEAKAARYSQNGQGYHKGKYKSYYSN